MTATERIKKDIIDNSGDLTMSRILNSEIPHARQFDISTGYFDVTGYGMLRKSLEGAVNDVSFFMRLLLGKEAILPSKGSFEKYARQYNEIRKYESIKASLDDTELTPESQSDTASLITLLEKSNVQVRLGPSRFNHSKCYILGNNSVFIGSSNFTGGGMTGNYELNAGLYQPGVAEQTREWFDRMWNKATDKKQDLIDVLKQSKFGVPPKPFEVYMKMLFERFKPLIAKIDEPYDGKTLTKFQQEAVHTSLLIISDFGGTIIADATGLGKTNMGIEIMRQKVLKEGKKILLIAPAQVLHSMWGEKLKDVDINVRETLTMESLGRKEILDELERYENIDFVLIDESQNFRSKSANRRKNLMKLMKFGKTKQAVLLTATPINNSLMDLYYQLTIITGRNDSYFYRTIGIPDLYTHMRDAANKDLAVGLEKIQQLLDTVMIRRTRSYIRDVYRDDKIGDRSIKFPAHQYSPIRYSLSELFGNIFERILDDFGKLTMAPYGLELYDNTLKQEEKDKLRHRPHLQVILLLKRFESSVEAVRISLRNKVALYENILDMLEKDKILRVRDFNKILTKWNAAEVEDDVDIEEERTEFFMRQIDEIEKQNLGKNYDVEKMKQDMYSDLAILRDLLQAVEMITVDPKIDEVVKTILREKALENESKKVLIFTEYTATAKYITRILKEKFVSRSVECITGSTKQDIRKKIIRRFAPKSNSTDGEKMEQDEIDILVSTEVLSEGQNLQDCNYVINYDLPWNPMRIVQRTGRIDRLTSEYDVIHTRACYPDRELDAILEIMGKIIGKLRVADAVIGGDEEVLGELPTPKQFNGTGRERIRILAGKEGADSIISDLEQESDIMPATSPINELSKYIKERGIDSMQDMPIGRRSGKRGDGKKAILAYLQEGPERRVYFVMYDFETDKAHVPDDDFDAIRSASCDADTPVHLPMDGTDNRESFELLLAIDRKARQAIREKNDQVLEYVKELKGKKKRRHELNIGNVVGIMLKLVGSGKVAEDDGREIVEIVKSEHIQPWEDDIGDLLADYNRTQEADGLITGLKQLRDYIGLQEKTAPIKIQEDVQISELKLIGAMFIMGDNFDENSGKLK